MRRFVIDPAVKICLVCGKPRGECKHTEIKQVRPERAARIEYALSLDLDAQGTVSGAGQHGGQGTNEPTAPGGDSRTIVIELPEFSMVPVRKVSQMETHFPDDMTTRIERVASPPSNQFDEEQTGGEPSFSDFLREAKRIGERHSAWLRGYTAGSRPHFGAGVLRGAGFLFALFVVLGLIYGIAGVSVAELLGFE